MAGGKTLRGVSQVLEKGKKNVGRKSSYGRGGGSGREQTGAIDYGTECQKGS